MAQLLYGAAEAARFLAGRGCTALRADSRRVRAGEGFVAWPGLARDGRDFVPQALAAGAAACLVEAEGAPPGLLDDGRVAALPGLKAAAGPVAAAFHGDPSAALDVIATTGTNGKTSTAWWVAQLLGALGRRCGLVGTLGIGEPPGAGSAAVLEATGLTTPDPVTLQGALADFARRGFAACAVEASSIGIVEQRLHGTRVAVALFTNFTRDHLDFHGTMQAYWAAKRALFDWPGLRAAVVNVDDGHGARLADELRAAPLDLWTVSLRGRARLSAAGPVQRGDGLAFDVVEGGQRVALRCALVGDYNASNLLVVVGAARALGVPLADIAAVVPRLGAVPGRLQPVRAGTAGEPLVLVDYAHTPDALDKLLTAVRPLVQARGGRLWCVFGCGGNRDASKRPEMGAVAARLADHVVLTSDNPRNEPPGAILAQIVDGIPAGAPREAARVVEDRAQAIAYAVGRAAPSDVVVLAGKGHEPEQEVAGVKHPFVDAEVAERALRARGRGGDA